jgi:hypothetical protein
LKNKLTITLPIHHEQKFKTKKSKTFLVGLNWYRNVHYRLSNDVKARYHDLTAQAVGKSKFGKIRLVYRVYVARNGTDGSNIRSVIEKFFLDGLVNCGAIKDDDVSHVLGDESHYFIDRENPRIEIDIIEQ